MSTVAMKHPELDGRVIDVPETAVPVYRQSGWEPLSEAEQADRDKQLAEESAKAEQAMQDLAAASLAAPPAAPSPPASSTKD